MRKKYTHIFFDLDNTLWDFKTNSRLAMQKTFEHFELENQKLVFDDFFEVYSRHNQLLWEAYRKKQVNKKDLIQRRFTETFKEFNVEGIDSEKINAFYFDEMPRQEALYPGVLETLVYLKEKRYLMFIITNGFKDVQHKKIQSSGLKPFFQRIFTSEEIKNPKPGKEIFEYAIKSSNAKKTESIMIGDDWDVDIMGASNFGIDSVYVSSNSPEYQTTKMNIRQIENLVELKDVF